MRILVTGSRYRPVIDVRNVLDRYLSVVSEIIVGDCDTGADEGARAWAKEHNVSYLVFHGDDSDHFLNFNQRALDEKPLLCLAFPIKSSTGTFACIEKARSLHIQVTIIPEFGNEPESRRNDDSVVYAVETDGALMKTTMKHVIEDYHDALVRLETL